MSFRLLYMPVLALLLMSFQDEEFDPKNYSRNDTEWREIMPPDSSFIIEYPIDPEIDTIEIDLDFGAVRAVSLTYDGEPVYGNVRYIVTYIDYPDTVIHSCYPYDIVRSFLDRAKDGSVEKAGGKIRSAKKTHVDGYPARRVTVDYKNSAVLNAEFILVKSRLYIIQVLTPVTYEFNAYKKRFLNSFKLIYN